MFAIGDKRGEIIRNGQLIHDEQRWDIINKAFIEAFGDEDWDAELNDDAAKDINVERIKCI